ncbi:MAG: hypothetical protein IPH37_16680 [Burkholderiales bacterium]|nr:hypothetical protein [Burkholderiales bacterium]
MRLNFLSVRRQAAARKAGGAAKDALLMPLRLGKAVFGYLNVFSMLYGKEPLRSAGGPRTPELDQDLGTLWLHGRRIELSKVRNDPEYAGNLVPASWKLIAQAGRNAAPEEIASHVAQFDVLADGSLLYSTVMTSTTGSAATHASSRGASWWKGCSGFDV